MRGRKTVLIAAAGCAVVLIAGLAHERWEVRWWCGKSLCYLGGANARQALEALGQTETDGWLRAEIGKMLRSLQ